MGGDDLGVARFGPPHPHPHPPELGVAKAALEALQPVVAGQAAAEAGLDLAEGQVDLVVEDDDTAQRRLEGAAGRPGGVARVVHVGLGQQDRHLRAAGTGAPFGDQAAELPLGARQLPAPGKLVGDLEADVVARPRVLAPGVAEADDKDAVARLTLLAAPTSTAEGGQRLLPAALARVAALAILG